MRWMIMLCLLAGCAASPEHAAGDAPAESEEYWAARRASPAYLLDCWDVPADDPSLLQGRFRLDLTLLDLDRRVADPLLELEDERDFAPRAYGDGFADAATSLAAGEMSGEVHWRRRIATDEDEIPLNWSRIRWLATSRHFSFDPLGHGPEVVRVEDELTGLIRIRPSREFWSTQVESEARAVNVGEWKWDNRTQTLAPPVVVPRAVEERETSRAAVETARAGQTAVFQLAEFQHGESIRLRLLFVRIAEVRE